MYLCKYICVYLGNQQRRPTKSAVSEPEKVQIKFLNHVKIKSPTRYAVVCLLTSPLIQPKPQHYTNSTHAALAKVPCIQLKIKTTNWHLTVYVWFAAGAAAVAVHLLFAPPPLLLLVFVIVIADVEVGRGLLT